MATHNVVITNGTADPVSLKTNTQYDIGYLVDTNITQASGYSNTLYGPEKTAITTVTFDTEGDATYNLYAAGEVTLNIAFYKDAYNTALTDPLGDGHIQARRIGPDVTAIQDGTTVYYGDLESTGTSKQSFAFPSLPYAKENFSTPPAIKFNVREAANIDYNFIRDETTTTAANLYYRNNDVETVLGTLDFNTNILTISSIPLAAVTTNVVNAYFLLQRKLTSVTFSQFDMNYGKATTFAGTASTEEFMLIASSTIELDDNQA